MRVYEYAKQHDLSSKELINILGKLDVQVTNHMSVMDDSMVAKVEKYFSDLKTKHAVANNNEDLTNNKQAQVQTLNKSQLNMQTQQQTQAKHQQSRQDRDKNTRTQASTHSQKPKHQDRTNGNRTQANREGNAANNQQKQGNQGHAMNNRPQSNQKNRKPFTNQNIVVTSQPDAFDILDDEKRILKGEKIKKQKPAMRPGGDNKENRSVNNPFARGDRGKSGGGKGRHDSRKGAHGNQQHQSKPNTEQPKKISIEGPVTVAEVAKLMKKESSEIIKKLLFLGLMVTINQEIDTDTVELLGSEYGIEVEVKLPRDEEAEDMMLEEEDPSALVPRPPVVTIMGHVDHGKTTLLDAIRETKVTASEAGGITQHIGAYQVEVNGKKITFLDTPGHAAFTTMRARGAQVTDITILVVAADDGVMPQTVEAINHAKAAQVPIIVAVNKIDKPGANPDRVKQELTEYGLVSEDWGGDTIFVHISALKKEGIEELLEMILLVAEMEELKANPNARPRGTIIEAQLDKSRGPAATVLVQNGTLRVGDIVVAGTTYGRVRAMVNDRGRRVKEVPPSAPVEIIGLSDVPHAGDLFVVYDDERKARALVEKRVTKQRAEEIGAQTRITLDDLYKQIQEGQIKDLNVIIKADVQGSVEALVGALEKIDIQGVRVRVIHQGVGAITESDIILATASNAIVIGFNVRPEPNAGKMAESEKVDVRLYRVIYNVIEELESAMKGMLDPEYKEIIVGRAEVRQTFKVSKVGTIAGCYVTEGKLERNGEVRVIRDGIVIYEGKLETLKRFKDDAREVAAGFECGLTLERFNDIKEGDIVEMFAMEAIKTH
jgi:translation initiation factor IF-2